MESVVEALLRRYAGQPEIEIEGKLGHLLDNSTGQRVALRYREPTALDASVRGVRFESSMPLEMFQRCNLKLNEIVSRRSKDGPGLTYQRVREIDELYGEVRVSRTWDTKAVLRAVRKERLGNVNIVFPNREVDVRISVSREVQVDINSVDMSSTPSSVRKKDRLRYRIERTSWAFDLTTVVSGRGATYELEVELVEPLCADVQAAARAFARNTTALLDFAAPAAPQLVAPIASGLTAAPSAAAQAAAAPKRATLSYDAVRAARAAAAAPAASAPSAAAVPGAASSGIAAAAAADALPCDSSVIGKRKAEAAEEPVRRQPNIPAADDRPAAAGRQAAD